MENETYMKMETDMEKFKNGKIFYNLNHTGSFTQVRD